MDRRIGAKRSPRLGAMFDLTRCSTEGLANAEIAGRERIGKVKHAHREVVRGPWPDAGKRGRGGDEVIEVAIGERQGAIHDRARERPDRGRPGSRHADVRDLVDRSLGDLGRGRKPERELRARAVDPRTERRGEPARDRGGGRDRDLLAEQRAHRGLETVERPGHAQAGVRREPRCQRAIAREHAADHVGTCVEVEQRADARDQRHHHRDQRRRELELQARAISSSVRHGDRAGMAIERDHAAIDAGVDVLDAWNRAGREEREQVIPVEWRSVVEPQTYAADSVRRGTRLAATHLRRGAAHGVGEQRVEPAQTSEARGERDVGDRQRRLLEQLLREPEPPGLRERDRRHAEPMLDRAPQVTRADTELGGELVDRAVIERALRDPCRRGGDQTIDGVDLRVAGRELGTTAEARAKPRGLGLRRGVEERAPRTTGCARRADRPAVDPRGRHADEEHAVEPPIAGDECGVARVGIHGSDVPCRDRHDAPFPERDSNSRSRFTGATATVPGSRFTGAIARSPRGFVVRWCRRDARRIDEPWQLALEGGREQLGTRSSVERPPLFDGQYEAGQRDVPRHRSTFHVQVKRGKFSC